MSSMEYLQLLVACLIGFSLGFSACYFRFLLPIKREHDAMARIAFKATKMHLDFLKNLLEIKAETTEPVLSPIQIKQE